MNITNKNYIIKSYINYLKNNDILFFSNNSDLNSEYSLYATQKNSKNLIIKKSISKNISNIIILDSLLQSFSYVLSTKVGVIFKKCTNPTNLKQILNNNYIFGLKFENKFYIIDQLYKIKSLNYFIGIKLYLLKFNSLLNIFPKLIRSNFLKRVGFEPTTGNS